MSQPKGLTQPVVNLPWVESPFFARELAARAGRLDPDQQRLATSFHDRGYVAVEQLVDHALCDAIVREVDPLFEDPETVQGRRVQDAWRSGCDSVRQLAILSGVQDLLRLLYERRPIPFQTLDFKWGTQQPGHSDSLHFSCLPARYMCGVWVALEDVGERNGPLFYYPGSHRLPELTFYDLGLASSTSSYNYYESFQHELMDELGFTPIEFHARKGDALIWSSNVVHGGKPVLDEPSTRWSQVTHYYFDDCIYYTPMHSESAVGELLLRDIVDLNTMERVAHSHKGVPVSTHPLGNGRSRISFGAESKAESPSEHPQVLPLREAMVYMIRSLESYSVGRRLLRPAHRIRQLEVRRRRRLSGQPPAET